MDDERKLNETAQQSGSGTVSPVITRLTFFKNVLAPPPKASSSTAPPPACVYSLLGPSSLRVVTNAVYELKGAFSEAPDHRRHSHQAVRSPKHRRTLLLPALADYESDGDSDWEYDHESDVTGASLTFVFPRDSGRLDHPQPHPCPRPPSRPSAQLSESVSAHLPSVSIAAPTASASAPVRPLVAARLRHLRLAAKLQRQGASTTPKVSKRANRKSVLLGDKENAAAKQI
ncbi:hypothetical protein C8R46DRAFT_1342096 [Mycena filopes]|nr:hypothetical protein C8R46DRAFT_1342096 [Mycena filopes]